LKPESLPENSALRLQVRDMQQAVGEDRKYALEEAEAICQSMLTPGPTNDPLVAGANIALAECMRRIRAAIEKGTR
jgi:hypothetical protein